MKLLGKLIRKLGRKITVLVVKTALRVRYRIKIKGMEKINPENLHKPGGILFLPNHPSELDPVILMSVLYHRFEPRPIIIEYMYYLPLVKQILDLVRGIPIPDFSQGMNSFKRARGEKVMENIIEALRNKGNILLYPAGSLKNDGHEVIGGASGVHTILEELPQVNVVLVRTTGLWGSRFSRAITGKTPAFFPEFLAGVGIALKGLLFFLPKRKVTVELEVAGIDFPFYGTRIEINRYLEKWFNQYPVGDERATSEPRLFVPYSYWSREKENFKDPKCATEVDISSVDKETVDSVIGEIARIARKEPEEITEKLSLANDLALDSLDVSELVLFLEQKYGIKGADPVALVTVEIVIAVAAKLINIEAEEEEKTTTVPERWAKAEPKRPDPAVAAGATIPEVFLNQCATMGDHIASGDKRSGILTYKEMKLRAIVIARMVQKLPGRCIGIMLPASPAANLVILGCQLAGKIPVMVNWTVGPRYLESFNDIEDCSVILSSWAFLNRLENTDLGCITSKICMLEDMRHELSLWDKITAARLAKKSTAQLLRYFNIRALSADDHAVYLFTSGTEGKPKIVPLSHDNILSNLRSVGPEIELVKQDIMCAILPPFHSFGFTVTGLFPILNGTRVVYYPNPTDSEGVAETINSWKATLLCAPPTFLKQILQYHPNHPLSSLRYVVSGAEKAPASLIAQIQEVGEHVTFLEGYGITECSPVLSFTGKTERCGIGRPIPGVSMQVVDINTHEPLPIGKQGLLLASGPNVFSGYLLKTPPGTFIEEGDKRWYNTGDLGWVDKEGHYILTGRLKRFVKVGGEMVNLSTIEHVLLEEHVCPSDEEKPTLAVVAFEEEGQRPKLCLAVTHEVSLEQVNDALRRGGMSNLVRIEHIVKVLMIPLLGSGKVDYQSVMQAVKESQVMA